MRYYAKLAVFAFLFCTLSSTTFAQLDNAFGKASYYSDTFHGSKTASGALYDKNKLTGAHKTLAYGTKVKVTRLDNKKSVTITINDRGPFIKGRIIEVSSAAANKIGLLKDGVTEVKIEVVGKGKSSDELASKGKTPTTYDATGGRIDTEKSVEEKIKEQQARAAAAAREKSTTSRAAKPKTTARKAAPASTKKPAMASKGSTVSSSMALRKDNNFTTYDLYKVSVVRPEKKGYGVQVASISDYNNVMTEVAKLESKWFNDIMVSVEQSSSGESVYKIILGYFDTREKANKYKVRLKKKKIDGFVVDLSKK